jgi:hypothetical protein
VWTPPPTQRVRRLRGDCHRPLRTTPVTPVVGARHAVPWCAPPQIIFTSLPRRRCTSGRVNVSPPLCDGSHREFIQGVFKK